MKIKNIKLEWNVIHYDFNSKKAIIYNVFPDNYAEKLVKAIRSKSNSSYRSIKNRDDLKTWLKREFMYHYWSKCEAEMVIGPWPYKSDDDLQKIDIWMQLEPNLDIITDYVINKMQIDFKEVNNGN